MLDDAAKVELIKRLSGTFTGDYPKGRPKR